MIKVLTVASRTVYTTTVNTREEVTVLHDESTLPTYGMTRIEFDVVDMDRVAGLTMTKSSFRLPNTIREQLIVRHHVEG